MVKYLPPDKVMRPFNFLLNNTADKAGPENAKTLSIYISKQDIIRFLLFLAWATNRIERTTTDIK